VQGKQENKYLSRISLVVTRKTIIKYRKRNKERNIYFKNRCRD